MLDPLHNVYAPSVSLGAGALVGDIETNSLQNSGGLFNQQAPFPASAMPPSPLLQARVTSGTTDITVAPLQIRTLSPGRYGMLADNGTVFLNPGQYAFAGIRLGDFAQLQAISGGRATSIASRRRTSLRELREENSRPLLSGPRSSKEQHVALRVDCHVPEP
ncbi:MAG: hypothetical protein ACREJ3_09610, partial [Polyangiaceae bacterium]